MTRWRNDTCPCVIEYLDDDNLTLTNIIKCPAHSILDNSTAYSTVKEENITRKNGALNHILTNTNLTALYDTINGTRILKENITLNISWTGTAPNRVLNISFTGITLTTNQKNTIQSLLNTKFGSGKVVIV